MLEALLAIMTALAPEAPRERLERVARAIAAAAQTREEAALLTTIDFYETRFERAGIPFGMVSWRRRLEGQPLEARARATLQMYAMTQRCGTDVAVRLGWFHTGHCREDSFSVREARTYREVLHGLPRSAADRRHDVDDAETARAVPPAETPREGSSARPSAAPPRL